MLDRNGMTDGVATRLKALRQNWRDEEGNVRKLSFPELSGRIQEEYGITIYSDTLKFYEAGEHHSRHGSNLGMRLEYLYILADFYQVSADYILGRDPYPISDRAKANISRICTTPYKDILNELLASAKLPKILQSLAASRLAVKSRIKEILDTESISEERLIEIKAEMRHLKRDNADDMADALQVICNYSSLDTAIRTKQEYIRSRKEAHDGEHPED